VDGINRKYPLVHQIGDNFYPTLAYAVVQGILDDKSMKKNVFDLIQKKSFIDREGNFLINWYGEGGTGRGGQETDGVFTYYSYHALIVAAIQKERGEESVISPEVFKDKIVLIGSNAAGLFEFHATPFSYRNLYPSLEIHATAIENMLSGDYIKSISFWNLFLLIGFITLLLLLINIIFADLRILLLAIIIILSGELITSYFLLSTKHLWISSAEMLFSSISVFLGLVISGYLLETHEKKFIHNAFGKYLAPSVVDYLIENPKMLNQMEGERREITVYFSDIEKFSTISEFLGPERLVKMLNEYFEEMTDIIQNHRGTVDRFEGDAIMAFYGAPVQFNNHAELACLACLEMQEKLVELQKKWQRDNIPEIYTRMGVNTGPVMVGNMGSFSRKQYSVVGDTVNLASRLESLNKIYGTYLMIGEETYKQVKHVIEVRELDRVRVVGKNQPVNVYELLSEKGMLSPSLSRSRDIFRKGIALYRERKWDEAIECFREVLNVFSADGPSKLFISRCKDFKLHPPSDEWDFVTNLSIK